MPKINEESKKIKKEAFLKSLKGGVSITESCKAANVSRAAIWEWRQKSKRFDNKVNAVIDSRTQSMEDALYANGINGNVSAQIFWLKNRDRKRWKDRFEHEITERRVIVIGAKEKKERENTEK